MPDEYSAHMPLFETERLTVRRWTLAPSDLQYAHRIYGDADVVRTIGGQVMPDLDATRAHIAMRLDRQRNWNGEYGAFATERKTDGHVVGSALIKPLKGAEVPWTDDIEIGWHLARAEWGKGYATEMGRGLVELARARGLSMLHAVVEPGNERSLAVARRLGFAHEGRTTKYYDGLSLEYFTLRLT